MNKRFVLAWLAVFVVWMIGDFIVHGMLLYPDYKALPALFRSDAEAQAYFPILVFAHFVAAGAFCWIYARGLEPRPWLGQGLRYGILMDLMTVVPSYLIYYTVQPMPRTTVLRQILFEGLVVLLIGLVVAFLYRGRTRETATA